MSFHNGVGRKPQEHIKDFCRDTPVRVSCFGRSWPERTHYKYGYIISKVEQRQYTIHVNKMGIHSVHEDWIEVASKLERLLYL